MFNPNQLMQMPQQQLPQQAQGYGMPQGIFQYGQPQNTGIVPPQMQAQTQPQMGGGFDRNAFRGQLQDWRQARPDLSGLHGDPRRQALMDWRNQRPQRQEFGQQFAPGQQANWGGPQGVQGLAAMHARNLDMSRPQIAPQGFAPQMAPQQRIAPQPQPIAPQAQPTRRGGY